MKNHVDVNQNYNYEDNYDEDGHYEDKLAVPLIYPINLFGDREMIRDGTHPPIFINPVEHPYQFRAVYATRNVLAKALGLTNEQMERFEFWLGCMDRGYRNETDEVLLVRERPEASEPLDILVNYLLPEAQVTMGDLGEPPPHMTEAKAKVQRGKKRK